MKTEIHLIENINTFVGSIPAGFDLVEYDAGSCPLDDGMCLYGFDEVGMFGFKQPKYAFVKIV